MITASAPARAFRDLSRDEGPDWRAFRALIAHNDGDQTLDDPAAGWEAMVELAVQHRVAPLLYRVLETHPHWTVPPATRAIAEAQARALEHSNRQLTAELLQVLDTLDDAGVRCAPFKSPELAALLYGDPTLRPVRDLDVLVHPEDLSQAIDALVQRGAVLHPRLSPAQMASYRRTDCQVWMEMGGTRTCVELHWAFREALYRFPLGAPEVLARTVETPLLGRSVPCLTREDLLLVLSIHGAKHGWDELKNLVDIHRLLEGPLQGPEIVRAANRLGCTRLLCVAAAFSSGVLGTRLPEWVMALIAADEAAQRLAEEYARLLVAGPPGAFGKERRQLFLRCRERLQDRLSYLGGLVFTPSLVEWNAVPLPDCLFPLYFAIRPLRLLARPLVRRLRLNRPTVLQIGLACWLSLELL